MFCHKDLHFVLKLKIWLVTWTYYWCFRLALHCFFEHLPWPAQHFCYYSLALSLTISIGHYALFAQKNCFFRTKNFRKFGTKLYFKQRSKKFSEVWTHKFFKTSSVLLFSRFSWTTYILWNGIIGLEICTSSRKFTGTTGNTVRKNPVGFRSVMLLSFLCLVIETKLLKISGLNLILKTRKMKTCLPSLKSSFDKKQKSQVIYKISLRGVNFTCEWERNLIT